MSRKLSSRAVKPSRQQFQNPDLFLVSPVRTKKIVDPIEPKNKNQERYISAIKTFQLTFGTGPAGVGKTWLCAALAAEALDNGETEKIIITRPAVESGESMGFLPGTLEEKFAPFLAPFREVLEERLGKSKVEYLIKRGIIEASPLSLMRGKTFNNSWIILDEAQNTTPAEMKMFLTRIGRDSTVIVNGDISQCDLRGPCGLEDAIKRVGYIPSVKVVTFTRSDVVRSGLVQEILEAYEN